LRTNLLIRKQIVLSPKFICLCVVCLRAVHPRGAGIQTDLICVANFYNSPAAACSLYLDEVNLDSQSKILRINI